MKLLNKIISYIKYAYAAVVVIWASIMCGINPKNELNYRKKASKKLLDLCTDNIIIEGKLDPQANLLIGNHTHNMDIPLIENVIHEKLIWVAKKELGEIPIIKNLLTKTDMILVDRKDKRSSIRMLKEIKSKTAEGYKVVLFPEGTRNKINPAKLQNWKKAPQAIAEKLNLKIQPFVIINLPFVFKDGIIEKKDIKVVFLESFYPYEGWYEDTKKKMQEILDKEYKEVK
ncbi:MAG: 1-acyl-sn-glycerol-3-phosphate acyltransferase [Epsilonproteobacteria bacterium]|nr:1-acyl-sn-glycerol-3-phosphate acyltransferase [Campylobacterota bacterium]